jgi:hypothetical protein
VKTPNNPGGLPKTYLMDCRRSLLRTDPRFNSIRPLDRSMVTTDPMRNYRRRSSGVGGVRDFTQDLEITVPVLVMHGNQIVP